MMGKFLGLFLLGWTVLILVTNSASRHISEQLSLEPGWSYEPYLDESFDKYVEETLEHWKVPGLSIAVVDGDGVYSKGYGYSTLPDEKATANTQYFTGSTTKAFTAAAIAQLVHNTTHYPDISWTSPINQILRADFVLEDEHSTTHTTIEDTLSHRTGLPRHDLIYGVAGDTPASIVQRLRHLPMTAEPRTTFQYCNLMYVVATEFLETVTGMKLETLLRDRLWKPLGMLSTSFTPALQSSSNIARGYYWDPSTTNRGYIPEPYLDLLPISGAGATISTVKDYALWIKALLSAAKPHRPTNSSSPITPALFHDLITPRTIISSNSPGPEDPWAFATPPLYALGWITLNLAGETLIMHEGSLTGFGSAVYLLPKHHFGIVMMGNTENTSNLAEAVLASELLKRKFENAKELDGSERQIASLKTFQETLLRISGLKLSKPNHNDPLKDHQTPNSAPQHTTSLPLKDHQTPNSAPQHTTSLPLKDHQTPNSAPQHTTSLPLKDHQTPNSAPQHTTSLPLKDHQTPNSAPQHTTSLPLPGTISDFAGLYTHPAYGLLNFTVPTNSSRSGSSTIPTLHAILFPRTWPVKLKLHHTTDTAFALEISSPHGLGDIYSEDDDILWEVEGGDGEEERRRAVFKFGLDGETVETIGIELEGGMVRRAREMGEKYWKEGMIWFERVGG